MIRVTSFLLFTFSLLYSDVQWNQSYSISSNDYNTVIKAYIDSKHANQLKINKAKQDYKSKYDKVQIILTKVERNFNNKKYFESMNELNNLNNNTIIHSIYLDEIREKIIMSLRNQSHTPLGININQLIKKYHE